MRKILIHSITLIFHLILKTDVKKSCGLLMGFQKHTIYGGSVIAHHPAETAGKTFPFQWSKIPVVLKRIFNWIRQKILLLGVVSLLGLSLPRLITGVYAIDRIYQTNEAPTKRVAIVFGAGLRRDGMPTAILRERVETAANLYSNGKVEKILMSGDNRFDNYNEPEAMRQYALSLGVPLQAIALDYAGRRTYDTCYRAKAIFGVDSALLVTQKFHLPRALFLCNALGLEASGVEANRFQYRNRSLLIWNLREHFATVGAFLDVYVYNPLPVLGDPEPLFAD
jgi:SanA protein